MAKPTEIDKKAIFSEWDEYYGPWFKCPYCENTMIVDDSKYCNQCGKEIECERTT